MERNTVLLFINDGFSDWEPSYASAGISKSNRYNIRTIGITKEPVVSMGGLRVIPDLEIREADLSRTAMLILPGGTFWEKIPDTSSSGENAEAIQSVEALAGHCLANDIPVAAICAATEFLARGGWLDDIDHTGNHPEFLRAAAPKYRGMAKYKTDPAVSGQQIITASGTSPIAFAREIFTLLGIDGEKELRDWFQWFEKFNTETVGLA